MSYSDTSVTRVHDERLSQLKGLCATSGRVASVSKTHITLQRGDGEFIEDVADETDAAMSFEFTITRTRTRDDTGCFLSSVSDGQISTFFSFLLFSLESQAQYGETSERGTYSPML